MSTPDAPSVSESSDLEDDELDVISLSEIPTIQDLYKKETLRPAKSAKYPPIKSYLRRVSLWQGDITTLALDSIVNAANSTLLGGGGVDGAIHRAAGDGLYMECRMLDGCDTGDAKITLGYDLPSSHVIHTVGPVYSRFRSRRSEAQLESCYKRCLQLAVENSLKHTAFPSISTGVYGYPIKSATRVALRVVRSFLESEHGDKLDRILFVVWSDEDKAVYERLIPEYFPPGGAETEGTEDKEDRERAGGGEMELDRENATRQQSQSDEAAGEHAEMDVESAKDLTSQTADEPMQQAGSQGPSSSDAIESHDSAAEGQGHLQQVDTEATPDVALEENRPEVVTQPVEVEGAATSELGKSSEAQATEAIQPDAEKVEGEAVPAHAASADGKSKEAGPE